MNLARNSRRQIATFLNIRVLVINTVQHRSVGTLIAGFSRTSIKVFMRANAKRLAGWRFGAGKLPTTRKGRVVRHLGAMSSIPMGPPHSLSMAS